MSMVDKNAVLLDSTPVATGSSNLQAANDFGLSSGRAIRLFTFSRFNLLLLALLGLAVLLSLAEIPRFLPVTGDNMYPEATGVRSAQRWSQGLPLYEDYRQPPYLVTAFPPLWYALLAVTAKVGAADMDSLTLAGRILSLTFLLGVAALAFAWNRRQGLTARLALVAPALYLAFPFHMPWAVSARPDYEGLFLAFFAVYLAAHQRKSMYVLVAAMAAALAFLMRHNAIAAPTAIVLWLAWSRSWKHAALFCAVWAVVVGLVVAPFQLSGQYVLLNLSSAKFGHFAISYVHDILNRLVTIPTYGFVLCLFGFGLFGLLASLSQPDDRSRLLSTYAIVSFAAAFLGTATSGGAVNHYLEPALVMAVLAPVALFNLQRSWEKAPSLASFSVMLLLLLLLPALDEQRWNLKHRMPRDLRPVVPLLQSKRVLTDVPYVAARTPSNEFLDVVSLINAELVGGWAGWTSATVVSNLQESRYDFVILSQSVESSYNKSDPSRYPHLDAAIQKAISANFDFCAQLKTSEVEDKPLYVYTPVMSASNPMGGSCPGTRELLRRAAGAKLSPTAESSGAGLHHN
jgi:hypothetical protein